MPLNLAVAKKEDEEVLRFDYEQIVDEESRNALMGAALAIKPLLRRAAGDIVKIGLHLMEVKNEQIPGGFMAWVDAEFEMNYRTAKRFMEVAERLGDRIDNLSTLPISALYMLARPSTPDEAIERVESVVAGGDSLTVEDVTEMSRNGNASYWSPPEPESPVVESDKPQKADHNLGEDEAYALIWSALGDFEDHPPLEEYAAGSWSLWLARNVKQWPPVHSCRLGLRKLIRTLKAAASEKMDDYFEEWLQLSAIAQLPEVEQIKALALPDEFKQWLTQEKIVFEPEHAAAFVRSRRESLKKNVSRPMSVEETKAAIIRFFEANHWSNKAQYTRLRDWRFAEAKGSLTNVVQDHVYLDEGVFLAAQASLIEDFREALGVEDERPQPTPQPVDELTQAQRDANAAHNRARQTKSQLSTHIRLALGHLPEAREDDFYDLTGTTTYSEARRKLIEAMHELEQTLDAVREV